MVGVAIGVRYIVIVHLVGVALGWRVGMIVIFLVHPPGMAGPTEKVSVQWVTLNPSTSPVGKLPATILQITGKGLPHIKTSLCHVPHTCNSGCGSFCP